VSPGVASLGALVEFSSLAISRLAVHFLSDSRLLRQTLGSEPGALLWILRAVILGVMILLPGCLARRGDIREGVFSLGRYTRASASPVVGRSRHVLQWIVFGLGFAVMLRA